MTLQVLTLFPEVVEAFCNASIVGRARQAGVVEITFTNFRDFATDVHRSVDDKPFGGGPGMVLKPEPVFDAVAHAEAADQTSATRILLTPQGRTFTQAMAADLARLPRLILICGHYEGFDERIRTGLGAREISVGDYVLSGGEAAALVVIDAVVRLLPGALGNENSTAHESYVDGLLEYPQYTRPRVFRGMAVPDILLSGDHQAIAAWRTAQARERTRQRRPDLLGPDPKT